MFKFLKTAPKPPAELKITNGDEPPGSQADAVSGRGCSILDAGTSADFEPLTGVMGMDVARAALGAIENAPPCALFFVTAPRLAAHRDALVALLSSQTRNRPKTEAVIAVHDFAAGGPGILRLPLVEARMLAQRVADAVEMLSVTIPAAFDGDSYKVARLALDEELRSGHDGAIDGLKRKAAAQNIGLLRTPQGYAVAPMHEGRVVQPEVLKALPGSLKSDVEAKLATFQGELAAVLKDRTSLQQAFRTRLRDLDREVAALAVTAALGDAGKAFAAYPAVVAYIDALEEDLARNAALFQSAARAAGGQPRAPVEIATDERLARFRVGVLSPLRDDDGLQLPETLDRADLAGEACGRGLVAGALTRAGNGIVLIDAPDLLAQYSAWLLVKRALRAKGILPADVAGRAARGPGVRLPVECRVVVTGTASDYLAWCRLDSDVPRQVRLIGAFEPAVILTPDMQHRFGRHIAAILAEDRLPPLDGPAIAALMHEWTDTTTGVAMLSADLDAVRDIVAAATALAAAAGRKLTLADDVFAALKARSDLQALLNEAAS